jgi:hypothetical protein
MNRHTRLARLPPFLFAFVFLIAPAAHAQRTSLKPGMNHYSPQDDITIGAKYAAEAQKSPRRSGVFRLCGAARRL